MRALVVVSAFLSTLATASETPLSALERRLQKDGPDAANAYLDAHRADMTELGRLAADCAPQAVDLAVKLGRTKDTKAAELHHESLRIAVGACTEYVLQQLTSSEVPKVCASAASWTVTQTARELRRRIADLDTDPVLRSDPRANACAAAYRYELQNTRIGLKVGHPTPSGKPTR